MKQIYSYISFLMIGLLSCNDSFLERFPETSISPNLFFTNVQDMELYTNTYYDEYINGNYSDGVSDNCALYADAAETLNLLRGNITPATVGGWSNWGDLRRFNFLLENVHSVTGDTNVINHYIGISRLMRARWYYDMIKRYNDVPWYSTSLKDTDEELLYKPRDPRTLVVDSIMADLDFAVKHISDDMQNKTLISKWYAYAIMARICLHEGTFRKYHTELNFQSTANVYLEKAIDAASVIMDSQLFMIDKTGGADFAYENLFINYDLSKSPEIILYKDYDLEANLKHAASASVFDFVSSLSRSLMESYQAVTEDGKAIPFAAVAEYDKKSMVDVFKGRDPRMKQTFMYPGYNKPNQSSPYVPNLNFGGYPQIKFVPRTADQVIWGSCYTDLPVCRYAEILLIYAEAKAELGTITQMDLDKSINLIRDRVNMPPTVLANIELSPDLELDYPDVSGATKSILLEIRRERRIELACEGFRFDDLMRWKAGKLLGKAQQGVYISELGLHDFTGDGIPDVGIFEDENSNPVPEAEKGKYAFYYLKNSTGASNSIFLSEGNSGFIMSTGDRDGVREFKEPQYYFFPIPQTQRILNSNLEETIFW